MSVRYEIGEALRLVTIGRGWAQSAADRREGDVDNVIELRAALSTLDSAAAILTRIAPLFESGVLVREVWERTSSDYDGVKRTEVVQAEVAFPERMVPLGSDEQAGSWRLGIPARIYTEAVRS